MSQPTQKIQADEAAPQTLKRLDALKAAPGLDFVTLTRAAHLDPGRDFLGADLTRLDLSGLDLTGFDLRGADLSGCNLSGTVFTPAMVRGACFSGAILTGARFGDVELTPVDMDTGDTFRDAPHLPEMVVLGGGRFVYGASPEEPTEHDNEEAQREVEVARFAIGRFPVTFAEYDQFCEDTKRPFAKDRGWGRGERPAINVSHEDAEAYAAWASDRARAAYRLPREEEWEYAARAGSFTATYDGALIIEGRNTAPVLDEIAWYGGNSGVDFEPRGKGYDSSQWEDKHHPHTEAGTRIVGQKRPNAWGLYDMLGNVWEWCDAATLNQDAKQKQERAPLRGGAWNTDARRLNVAYRRTRATFAQFGSVGFRLVRDLT